MCGVVWWVGGWRGDRGGRGAGGGEGGRGRGVGEDRGSVIDFRYQVPRLLLASQAGFIQRACASA